MMRRCRSLAIWIAVAAAGCVSRSPQPAIPRARPVEPTRTDELQARLDRLTERLEAARVEHHVPGMAIAVVRDDEVLLIEGFGLADIRADRPVTPETVFAIGSSTKAFTSALVGTYVDEGKLSWDDPIEQHLPQMRLAARNAEHPPTLRDAMCHRTGFSRMGVLWAGGGATPAQMFATASKAEPWADLGAEFAYNNVVYAAAGEAVARVAGKPWSELVTERIFMPLKMKGSSTSIETIGADRPRAQGYHYDDAADRFDPLPMRNVDLIGPAGAINSTVTDMAQWLRLQLGRGQIDGVRVISAEALETTWTPQIEVRPGTDYGLGWYVRSWKGHRVVEHGGNMDGFSAAVALMPDDGLGFVLLTNVGMTPLQSSSLEILWSTMLDPLEDENADAEELLDLTPYVGKYVADVGPWDDARMTVIAKDGKLHLDIAGRTVYELLPPDSAGRWKLASAPQVAASFDHVEDGRTQVLRLHRGGLDFEMPREGYAPPPEIDLERYRGCRGRYATEDGKASSTVVVRGNRLALATSDQLVYELHPPDPEGRWRFRIKEGASVSFRGCTRAEDRGKAVTLVIDEGGTKTTMKRTGDVPPAPTLAELQRRRRGPRREKAIAKLGVLVLRGTVRVEQAGLEGKTLTYFDGERVRTEVDFGPFGNTLEVCDGEHAWTGGSLDRPMELRGKYRTQVLQSHPLTLVRQLSRGFETIEVAPPIVVDGHERIRLTLQNEDLPAIEALADPTTGDVVKIQTTHLLPGMGRLPVTDIFSDFREVHGLRIPFRIVSENPADGRSVFTIDRVQRVQTDTSALFPAAPPATD